MAKIKGLAATALMKSAGKLTFRNTIYGNVASQKIVNMTNPMSSAQGDQRVLVSTISKGYSLVKAIANHSFQGISTGAKSMNEFKKVNSLQMKPLNDNSLFYYAKKLNKSITLPFLGQISEGTLVNNAQIQKNSIVIDTAKSSCWFKWITSEKSIELLTCSEMLALLGIESGNELTFCNQKLDRLLSNTTVNNSVRMVFDPEHYVLKETADEPSLLAFEPDANDATIYHLSHNFVDQQNSSSLAWMAFKYDTDTKTIMVESMYEPCLYMCTIISKKVDGVWQRSTDIVPKQSDSDDIITAIFDDVSIYPDFQTARNSYVASNLILNNATT